MGRKMVYEISSAQKGSKATMMAIAPRFLDKLFESDIELVSGLVYDNNPAGMNHIAKRFGFLVKEGNKQTSYTSS